MSTIINYAHRGASAYYPENTMIAFEKAVDLGATGIETDVHMTKDGELVLIHDGNLKRTAGINELVKNLTLDEIKKVDVGSWLDPKYKNERILTLDEFLGWASQKNIYINLELKSAVILYPGIEKKVVETVRAYGMTERIIISSFNHYSLVDVKRIAPEIRVGVLYAEALYEPWLYAKYMGASALHPIHYAVMPEFVSEAKKHGIVYNPYTVNEIRDMKRLIDCGVNGMITNYPDRLASLL